jgi:hypothetical protein
MIGIGFSTVKKNLLSRIIRKATASEFSHTWPVYEHPLYKSLIVVDADIHNIHEVETDVYLKKVDNAIILVPPDGVDLEAGMPALGKLLSRPYGVLNLIGHGIVILLAKFGRRIKNPFRNQKKPACIETSYCLLQAAGILVDIDPEEETPQSLHDRLVKLGWRAT